MAVVIPTRNDIPAYTLRVDLSTAESTAEYLLGLTFNEREGAWYLDVSDQLAVPIWHGKIVLGFPLMRACVDGRRPRGDFFAIDTTNAGLEPSALADIGDRVLLVYEDGSA
jgi:hypothetical protein